ncbi:UNVERIFIED_CONTAM: Zinc finger CCCH domain-containing protein 6 [Sesamum calycinum]|uniref:Zinc finger CCCH domain-containing protein 6 n=1 Tax=Sesamum calycinum TaxID=2727403 RepID=A0AAW2P757_9LAMI
MGAQDHLQAKAFSGGMGSDDNLPPGFEGIQPANPWIVKLAQIPLAKWKCPPRPKPLASSKQNRITCAGAWGHGRGSPSALVGAEDSSVNDRFTPLVPITPIEDEDATLDTPLSSMAANSNSLLLQPQHSSHATFSTPGSSSINLHANGFPAASVEPDIVAAAQAALTSVMSNADQGNLIDRELLIKILSDPK